MTTNVANSFPDKLTVIEQIKQNFPKELLTKNIWLAYYYRQNTDGTYSKPPCSNKGYSVQNNSPGVSFEQACLDGYPGIKMSVAHNLVAFDVDDKEAKTGKRQFNPDIMSNEFKAFLAATSTYTELSPSKCGLRILVYCEDKSGLPGRTNLSNKHCIGGELYISSGYVTITGNSLSTNSTINSITKDQLLPWYSNKTSIKKADQNTHTSAPVKQAVDLPSNTQFLQALRLCKLDKNDRVKKAYESVVGQAYSHYDFWIKIMSASHNYATMSGQQNDVLTAILSWSQEDKEAYESDEDVIKHWESLSASLDGITYHTLFKFARLLKFKWPQEAFDKDGHATGKPLINSYENFEYLMHYYSVSFCRDIFNGCIYVTADEDALSRYFMDFEDKHTFFGMVGPFGIEDIKGITWQIAQNNHYVNVTYSTISPLIKHFLSRNTRTMNMMKLWLETDPAELPKDMQEPGTDISKSTLEYLLSCITFNPLQEKSLIDKYFETFFFEMVMPIYNPHRLYSQRSFMLVLTGPENCRKTTFFTMLFPPSLRRQFVTNSTETLGGAKSIRDFSTSLVTSALVVTDEFEIFYNQKNDSLFKTYVTSDVIDYVPIYEKTMRKEYKNAVLAGTTNKRSLAFEQDSNRRLAMIDVRYIDTSKMECINWHHFYRTFIELGKAHMAKGKHPWKLSKEVIAMQYEYNEHFRAQSNVEIIFTEIFDFGMLSHKEIVRYDTSQGMNNPHLYKLNDILGTVKQRYPEVQLRPAETKHLLKRLCGRYTHTTNLMKQLQYVKGTIENGIVVQGQYTRYVMPPILSDFEM